MTGVGSPQPDLAFQLAELLLARITDRLTDAGDRPGRIMISDGIIPPIDDCCEGLLWARVTQITATDGAGTPVALIYNGSIPTMAASIGLEAGILRCSPVLGADGEAPDPDAVTASALQAAADRTQLRMAVLCDFPKDIVALDCDGQAVGAWIPVDGGGCNGGFITTAVGASSTMII